MEKIRVITDSASDISVEEEKAYDIEIIPFDVILGSKSYVSRVDVDNEGFYKLMEECDDLPLTSQITPYRFQEIFLKDAEQGFTDLVVVLINSQGSATHGNALMAKDAFFEEHPEYQGKVNIDVYDGRGYNAVYGYPVVNAARMVQNGSNADAVRTYLSENIDNRQLYFGIYSLKYAGKSGRIPSAAAFIGDKLNLKPIMKIADNQISTAAKVRGEGKLISKAATLAVNDMEPGTPYQVVYGCDESCRDEMTKIMTEKTGYAPDGYYQIGAAVAANAGPKVCGVAFQIKK